MNLKAEIVKRIRKFSDSKEDSIGTCSVCGQVSRFVYSSWAIDEKLLNGWKDEDVAKAYLFRESMFCSSCDSSYRVRRLASELIKLYSPEMLNLRQLLLDPGFSKLKILEINEVGSFGSLHRVLKSHPGLTTTCFIADGSFGSEYKGKSIQNLESLTFEDGYFDLVIHSDVLEHIPHLELAKREMYRVLKPKGTCVFTVPINLKIKLSFSRAKFANNGQRVDLHQPLFHGRGGGPFSVLPARDDYLEVTSFGADAADVLVHSSVTIEEKVDAMAPFSVGEDLVFVASKNS